MKRFLSLVLIVTMLLTVSAYADEATSDEAANSIFTELAYLYDAELFFLEQRQITWNGLINAPSADKVTANWFYENIVAYTNLDRHAKILEFALHMGFSVDELNYSGIYENLFLPMYEKIGKTDDGLRIACFAFTQMIFWDETIPSRLDAAKTAIRDLMSSDPNYAYISDLQNLYKAASQVYSYIIESHDNYVTTGQRISEFQQARRTIKSDFEFILDWPEFKYSVPTSTIYPLGQSKSQRYQEALRLLNAGQYLEAYDAFIALGDYEDSAEQIKKIDEVTNNRRIVIAWDWAYNGGMAYIKTEDGKQGFIDSQGNILTIAGDMEIESNAFGDGLYVVKQNNKYGYIDGSGEIAIPCQFDNAFNFSEGLAAISKDGKWGYINTNGEIVIKCQYERALRFKEGLAWVKITKNKETVEGFIDTTGKEILFPSDFSFVDTAFSNGLIAVKGKNGRGFVNQAGKVIIPMQYLITSTFHDGIGAGYVNDGGYQWKIFDSEGNDIGVFTKKLDSGYLTFHEGFAGFCQDGRYGICDSTGTVIVPPLYDGMDENGVHNGLIAVKSGEKWGFIDTEGNVVIPIIYESYHTFYDGFALVKYHGYWFIIDTEGNFI